jgi:hypothetical protein
MLGLLHTGAVHVETFESLVRALEPGVATRHAVREDLLTEAARAGLVTTEVARAVQAEILALVEQGARVVLCTCSTLGSAAEATSTGGRAHVLRVDRPLAQQLVASGRPVLVVAALPSAMATAAELLHAVARERQQAVRLRELPCTSAWPSFLAGDRPGYLRQVAQQVEQHALPGEQVMLAQASMAGAVPLIQRPDVQAFTSPELGVRAALGAFQRLHQDSSVSPPRD